MAGQDTNWLCSGRRHCHPRHLAGECIKMALPAMAGLAAWPSFIFAPWLPLVHLALSHVKPRLASPAASCPILANVCPACSPHSRCWLWQ
jgi:hypothetical protein